VKYAWITRHGALHPIVLTCRLLDISTVGYYDSLRREPSLARSGVSASMPRCARFMPSHGSFKIARALARRDDLESACRNPAAW
jgi:hypothetical protein